MKQEIVMEDKTPRLERAQSSTREEQRTCANSCVVNDATTLKLKRTYSRLYVQKFMSNVAQHI